MPHFLRYLVLLFLATATTYAQSDTIIPNPKAVQLRRIWMVSGAGYGAILGIASGSVGDINGDSLGDFAVLTNTPWQWQVFLGKPGGPLTTPTWTFDSGASDVNHPIVGDFWGTGRKAVGFLRHEVEGPTHYWLHIFRTESNQLDSMPAVVWDSWNTQDSATLLFCTEIIGADLDGDGDDELIIANPAVRRRGVNSFFAETWIYEGGPDFQVDTPTVVLRDTAENTHSSPGYTFVDDLDNDGNNDLIRGEFYRPGQQLRLSVYWGDGGLPVTGQLPDRAFFLAGLEPFMADVDGDSRLDIVSDGPRIWRSGVGKDARTRSFDPLDADNVLVRSDGQRRSLRLGYLNSSRYEVIGRRQGVAGGGEMLSAFSGGSDGPNRTWDGYYTSGTDGLIGSPFHYSHPIGDVDGDGWRDVLISHWAYPDNILARGIAIILAGGSYIPNDDPSVGVRDIGVAGVENAVSIWPNAATTELNIAWRGDLARRPHRFEVYDVLGQRVAEGVIEDGSSALWRCDGVAAGTYRLCIYDAAGRRLGTASVVKL